MRRSIVLSAALLLALSAPVAFAGDEPKATPRRSKGEKGQKGEGAWKHLLARFDKDGDQAISKTEVEAAAKEAEARHAQKKKELLDKLDKDGDGKLSKEERRAAHAERDKNPGADEKHAKRRAELLKKFDKDGDGKLSKEERAAATADRKKGEGKHAGRVNLVKDFDAIDADHDAKVTKPEWDAAREAARAAKKPAGA